MNTDKTTPALILSYFARLVLLSIGCFMMSFLVLSVNSNIFLRVVLQLISFALMIMMTYSFFYAVGENDSVLVNCGKKARRRLRGFWIGAAANLPFFISGLLLLAEKSGMIKVGIYKFFKIINSAYYPLIDLLLPVDLTVSELHYADIFAASAVLLIAPIMAGLSYLVGSSRFSFREALFYKKIADTD